MNSRQHIQAFTYLFQQKGYHETFVLNGAPIAIEETGLLQPLLEKYCFQCQQAGRPIGQFTLQTYAVHVNAWQFIGCEFSVEYGDSYGFRVNELCITHNADKKVQRLPVRDNHQIPGRFTVLGMFRKPKRWEQIMLERKTRRRGL